MTATSSRLLLWNSSVALILAGMLSITLHELSHFVASLLLGDRTTLLATSSSAVGDVTTSHAMTTAATGPIFSVVFGLVVIFASRRWGVGFARLLWMWLGFTSAQVGFGYLMIAIIAPVGDTGKVLELLDAPPWVFVVSLVLGIAGTLWLSRMFATRVVSYSGGSEAVMRSFGIFSWLIGTGALVLIYLVMAASLPGDALLVSMMGIVAIAIFAPMFSFFYKRVVTTQESLALRIPIVGIVLAVVVALILIFVVNRGITLG